MAIYLNVPGKRILSHLAACIILIICWTNSASAEKLGQFKGELVLKVLSGGRDMELVQPFEYVDSHDVNWPVPAGTRVDGASIPRVFWSLIGAPLTGKYREASVIHDYYSVTKSRHWKAVHRVFLDGMLARGVNELKAQLMYLAVYRFATRWDFDIDACFCKGCPSCANPSLKRVKRYKPEYNVVDFEELRDKLKEGRFTLVQLEDVADYQLFTEIFRSR